MILSNIQIILTSQMTSQLREAGSKAPAPPPGVSRITLKRDDLW